MGDFSRATHLSVKTLRHYHQVGLLEPAAVNADTGYRYYSAGQIPTAQVIRRLRDLEMPVADVKAVLAAPDAPARNALIAAHLNRLEAELDQTRTAVESLRKLLQPPDGPAAIEHRSVPAAAAAAIGALVDRAEFWPGGRVPWANCGPPSAPRTCTPPGPAAGCSPASCCSRTAARPPCSSPCRAACAPSGGSRPW